MSQAAQVFVLAEDLRHRMLIRRHLRKRGYTPHRITELPWLPNYETPCLKFVLEELAVQVQAIRAKHSSHSLIAVVDADDFTVAERIAQLEKRLTDSAQLPRQVGEPIAFVVPRRNVETWLHYLEGNAVDEETDYKPLCRSLDNGECARKFADCIVARSFIPPCPPSLEHAGTVELPKIP